MTRTLAKLQHREQTAITHVQATANQLRTYTGLPNHTGTSEVIMKTLCTNPTENGTPNAEVLEMVREYHARAQELDAVRTKMRVDFS